MDRVRRPLEMRLSQLVILLALVTAGCETTMDPELEREIRYLDSLGE